MHGETIKMNGNFFIQNVMSYWQRLSTEIDSYKAIPQTPRGNL